MDLDWDTRGLIGKVVIRLPLDCVRVLLWAVRRLILALFADFVIGSSGCLFVDAVAALLGKRRLLQEPLLLLYLPLVMCEDLERRARRALPIARSEANEALVAL